MKRPYVKPLFKKETRMDFPLKIINAAQGAKRVCRQCSGCHGCR